MSFSLWLIATSDYWMNYVISDFRNLVGAWFNEFLPSVAGKKAVYVEKAGIVYINNLNMDSMRKPTMKFIRDRIGKMLESNDAIHIFVMEPKPVNNVRIMPALKMVEDTFGLDEGNRDRILHLANRRYVLESPSVYVSQNKELDEFLSGVVFSELSRMSFLKARFYSIQSLGISDFLSCAYEFFPKSALTIQGNYECETITVHSSNDVLGVLSDKVMKGKPMDSGVLEFVMRCRNSILDDMSTLV